MTVSIWRRLAVSLLLALGSGALLAQGTPAASAKRKPLPAAGQAPAAPKPGQRYAVAPLPGWVVLAELPGGAPAEAAPMHYRVIDDQIRVDATGTTAFSRIVRVVNQAAGLAQASQIELDFDPSYQTLTLHRVDLVRDGRRIDKLDHRRIELLQREKQLEQRIYDGQLTASIVIDDVRVGDEIDFAYSLSGQNPVFGGRFVAVEWMATHRGPARLVQTRLLAPARRTIRVVAGPADATVRSDVAQGRRETVWRREHVRQLRQEPGAPASALLPEMLQLSEFADWAEVATWGDTLFAAAASGPQAAALAATIRSAHPRRMDQLQEALRFVQQEVRYFGIAIGPGSHRPQPADRVLQQRFGDCKDKVTLLSALLRELGIPVRPVLVSTRLRERAGQQLASPLAFDHVIARVDLDDQVLWLDPTRSHQGGPLAARQAIGLGQGLELVAGSTALVQLPAAFDSERMRVEDRLMVGRMAEAPTLESRVIYRGDLAEWIRGALADQGLPAIADAVLGPYLKVYPQARRLAPAELQNLPDDDAVALVQRLELPGFWRFPEQRALLGDIVQWGPVDALMPPKTEARSQPWAFSLPGIYRHRVQVEFAEDVYQQAESRRSDDGDRHFSLSTRVESTRNSVDYTAEVRIRTDQVEPAHWTGYMAALQQALPKLGTVLGVAAVPLARVAPLQDELRQLDEGLQRRRVKAVTSTQARAHFRVATLTAQLDSGRLAPALRAQALVARGVAYDHLGHLGAARSDFESALAIDSDLHDALNAAAANAQARGDTERAVALSSQALLRQPGNSSALHTRALAHYGAGRLTEARADWEQLLGSDPAALRRGYPLALLALAVRRSGQDPSPLLQKYPRVDWPGDWPRPVLDALFDGTDDQAVVQAAKSSKTPLEAQTEAHYYLAERAAADGDMARARAQWRRVVELGVVEYVEFNAARQRLEASR